MNSMGDAASSNAHERSAFTDSAFGLLATDISRSFDELRHVEVPGYVLLNQLDSGGQGIVFQACQQSTGRIVAIKFLIDGPLASAAQRARFEREVRIIARVRHPGVVAVIDCGQTNGRLYYSMEFVEGLPIDDYVVLHDLSPQAIVALTISVARTLAYTHRLGVIHRDLKPANLLVDQDGRTRVCDFGLAKDLQNDGFAGLSDTTPVIGTLPFTAPEQLDPIDAGPDVRSDVYSLAVVLYYLLADSYPYPVEGDRASVCRAILSDPPVRLTDRIRRGARDRAPMLAQINADLDAIVSRALSKNKEDRYGSMDAFADDLARYLSGEAVHARSYSRMTRAVKFIRRHWLATGASTAVISTLAIATLATSLALRSASDERDRAALAASTAFNMFDLAANELDESIRRLPGGLGVRDRVQQRVASELESLEVLVRNNPNLELLRLDALSRRAEVAQSGGDLAVAHKMFRSALDELLARAANAGTTAELVERTIVAYRKVATTAEADARDWFERGASFLESHTRSSETLDRCRAEAAKYRCDFAHWAANSRDFRLAVRQAELALSLLRSPKRPPEDAMKWSSLIASALESRGRASLAVGDGHAAIGDLRHALELRRDILASRPADAVFRRELIRSCIELARVERGVGNLIEAMEFLEAALDESSLSMRLDPEASGWAVDPIIVHREYAELIAKIDLPYAAAYYADRAVSIARNLVDADPQGTESTRALGYALLTRGKVRLGMGLHRDALTDFEAALGIRQNIVESAEAVEIGDLSALSAVLGSCGRANARLNDRASAQCYLLHAHEVALQIEKADPMSVAAMVESLATEINLIVELKRSTNDVDLKDAQVRLISTRERLDRLRARGNLDGFEAKIDEIENGYSDCADKLQRPLSKR